MVGGGGAVSESELEPRADVRTVRAFVLCCMPRDCCEGIEFNADDRIVRAFVLG